MIGENRVYRLRYGVKREGERLDIYRRVVATVARPLPLLIFKQHRIDKIAHRIDPIRCWVMLLSISPMLIVLVSSWRMSVRGATGQFTQSHLP